MTDKDLIALLIAVGSGLAGVVLGFVGSLVTSSREFKHQKDERRKEELREGYKRTWFEFNNLVGKLLDLATAIRQDIETGAEIKKMPSDYGVKFDLDQAEFHVLAYMRDGEDTHHLVKLEFNKWGTAYAKLVMESDASKRNTLYLDYDTQNDALITFLQSIKAEAMSLLRKL